MARDSMSRRSSQIVPLKRPAETFSARAGIFERVQYPEIPARIEYRLTPFGKKFSRLLEEVERLQKELDREG